MLNRITQCLIIILLPALLIFALMAMVGTAQAATLTVNTATDETDGSCSDGDCSLRDAIALAANGDTITFDGDFTIYLTSTLTIDKHLTIDGSGHTITVSGDSGGDGSPNTQVFSITHTSIATLTHLSIVSGTTSSTGWTVPHV